jgi:Ni/Co efflux regulator RcnB
MKRLILSLVAALMVAGPLASSEALAKDRRGGWEQRGGDRGDRGGGRWRADERGPPRGQGRWERPRDRNDDRPPPGAYGVRRGGYMPPEAAPPVIEDPARHRLRTPPRGYNWVRVPGGYALVDGRTGQIFDMVPAR